MNKKFITEFKEFICRGNVIDMAVGVIIGGAFKGIIDSLVSDVIMPLIALITGGIDFSHLFISLDGNTYKTIEQATQAGASIFKYGNLITAVINFLLMAFVIFLLIKLLNKISFVRKKEEQIATQSTKKCPYCKTEIAIDALKCPNCTSEIE